MFVPRLFSSSELRVLLLLAGVAVAVNCGGGGDIAGPPVDPPVDPPGPPAVATVEVTPTALNLAAGQTSQLTVTVRAADGNALTGRTVTWATGDAAIATVGESGIVTAVAPGQVQVTATSEGKTGAAAVTVSEVPVATVEVTPSPASVAVGQTGQLVAVPKSAANAELLGRPVTWTTADAAVATVSQSGVVTGVAVGEVTITATSEGRSGTSQLTVSATPVATVTVTPPTASIAEGATVDLTATAKDANGGTLAGRAPTWSSSSAAVASVNASGKVTGVTAGTATIIATIEGKTGSATITVTRTPVATVEVTPAAPTVTVGQTVQLVATVKEAQGRALQGRAVTWATSAAGVATVNASGLVTGVAAGTATITATSETVNGTTTVTVTAAAGITRIWKGGASGRVNDWTAPANWDPAGTPTPLDTVRVVARPNFPVLKGDVQIARLIIAGGRLRTAGFRLNVRGR